MSHIHRWLQITFTLFSLLFWEGMESVMIRVIFYYTLSPPPWFFCHKPLSPACHKKWPLHCLLGQCKAQPFNFVRVWLFFVFFCFLYFSAPTDYDFSPLKVEPVVLESQHLHNTLRMLRNTHGILRNLFVGPVHLCHWFTEVHWPPMNKFSCKLHGYIVYLSLNLLWGQRSRLSSEVNVKQQGHMSGSKWSMLGARLAESSKKQLTSFCSTNNYHRFKEFVYVSVIRRLMRIISQIHRVVCKNRRQRDSAVCRGL